MKCSSIFRIFLATILCMGIQVEARWATRDDAAVIREFFNTSIVVHADGTYSKTDEFQDVIVKDQARDYGSGFTLYYTAGSSKLKILSAKTSVNGKTYEVPADKIEDKPLASSPHGFDQTHQVLISFPRVKVGAKIYIKYRTEYTKVPVRGAFDGLYFFGVGPMSTYWEKAHVNISSKIPLSLQVNDPDNALKITKDGNQRSHKITIDLTKPLIKDTENEYGDLNSKYQSWFCISSYATWEELASKFSNRYAAVINQELPKKLRKIKEAAQKMTDEIAQINEVTSRLNDQIQYMGDWRTIEGGYIPRPLKVIGKSGVGDCKDFTACTCAILKNMGYEVYPALVWRGGRPSAEDTLPRIGAANHAFLKVKGKEGRTYWIDPTNFESMAQGTFFDIAGKMAIVLDPKNPTYEPVPEISVESAQEEQDLVMFVKNKNVLEVVGQKTMKGETALGLTGIALNTSPENIAERMFSRLAGTHLQPHEKKLLELPDLKSRIVKDITMKFAFDHPTGVYKTNMGVGLSLQESVDFLLRVAPDQVGDLSLGMPLKETIKRRIKNGPIKNIEKLNYSLKTPWLEVERECRNVGDEIEILVTITYLKRYIPVEDLQSKAYKDMKASLEWNMKDVILILGEIKAA